MPAGNGQWQPCPGCWGLPTYRPYSFRLGVLQCSPAPTVYKVLGCTPSGAVKEVILRVSPSGAVKEVILRVSESAQKKS
jgi:hypothetical protein